jgi:mRNA interferase HicA
VKRVDLIRKIEGLGCVFIRHGGRHDWYANPLTGMAQPVPRHREIKEHLARRIIKLLSDPEITQPTDAEEP